MYMKSVFFVLSLVAAFVLIAIAHQPLQGSDDDGGNQLLGKLAPEFASGNWINSSPQTMKGLKGKVVLVEFWTFECYNCRNTLPSVIKWSKEFADKDFVIVGVHTPELDRERDFGELQKAVKRLGITYPVVTDNDYKTWNAYNQQYWPVMYLIDKKGIVQYIHIGEGNYDVTEQKIQGLLRESS
jgi:thiol-disulfide isomerase/thioredoxin